MIAHTNKELKMLDKAANEFARKELAPGREENDKFPFGPFFDSILKKSYNLDFFHTTLPEEMGGIGQGISSLCIVLDNICREDGSLGGIILTTAAAQEVLLAAESTDLLKQVTDQADKTGKVNDFLIAMPIFVDPSETGVPVKAEKGNDGYVLNGSLEYLVLGGLAGHALVPASIDGIDGYAFFLVDLAESGLVKSGPVHSLGFHACPAIDLTLKDVPAQLVGKEGSGAACFEKMTARLSIAAAAMALGIMKGSFKEAMDYTQKRSQGGRTIINWSELKLMLANMAIDIKNAELAISRACMAVDANESGWKFSSIAAALKVQETACSLTTDGIQVMGGVGYMKDFGQEKRFRDAKQIQALFGITPKKKLKYLEHLL